MRTLYAAFSPFQKALLGISLLFILVAWLGTAGLQAGFHVTSSTSGDTPLQIILPQDAQDVPGVVVAHGFGGSKQLMLGFAHALARAGYAVALLDFPGHAANPLPLEDNLLDALYRASAALAAQPQVDPDRIALLGHSMGSGAVMRAGIERPGDFSAVIAVSPTSAQVSPTVPSDLLLMAGSLEPRFVSNAEELLVQAGGRNADASSGLARELVVVPGVEHITILFSASSRETAVEWLDSVFDRTSPPPSPDLRMLWYGLHLAGWLMLAAALTPAAKRWLPAAGPSKPGRMPWAAALTFPYLVTLLFIVWPDLVLPGNLLGFIVGGSLTLWFLLLGLGLLLLLGLQERPSWRPLVWGLLYFAMLWLAMGLIAQFTWMQWFLIAPRLVRWPLIVLACLPWKYALGSLLAGLDRGKRLAAWLAYSLVLVSSLFLFAFFVPGMFVVSLIAPVVPLILGVEIWLGSLFRDQWAYAVGSALFFGWMIASFFPLG